LVGQRAGRRSTRCATRRWAAHRRRGHSEGGAAWLLYLRHLSLPHLPFWVPLGVDGIRLLLCRRKTRLSAIPVTALSPAYFYVLSTHSHVFGRYALPLVPIS
jgi:hypothetical protein